VAWAYETSLWNIGGSNDVLQRRNNGAGGEKAMVALDGSFSSLRREKRGWGCPGLVCHVEVKAKGEGFGDARAEAGRW
jgi:hypothetical protein